MPLPDGLDMKSDDALREFSQDMNEWFASTRDKFGCRVSLVKKVFWKFYRTESLRNNLQLAESLAAVAILKVSELVAENYDGDDSKWCKAIRRAMVDYIREQQVVFVSARRQRDGNEPLTNVGMPFELLDGDDRCEEIWDRVRWLALSDPLTRRIVDALERVYCEKHDPNKRKIVVSNAEIARRVGCDPKTVADRREKLYAEYAKNPIDPGKARLHVPGRGELTRSDDDFSLDDWFDSSPEQHRLSPDAAGGEAC